jgi:hypothetical protein
MKFGIMFFSRCFDNCGRAAPFLVRTRLETPSTSGCTRDRFNRTFPSGSPPQET